ncbi:LysM peptidoglycan-binding domain-containing protein [Kangiella sp. HD9-110m-PIT-SAG07]|nr:LysM peptidoglycan-binding domain-containing protein [Kangiella sp. HD9-110m-PIT-SAG07]
MISSAKLTAIAMALTLAGCSFKEDRKDIVVPIIDATPAKSTNHQLSAESNAQSDSPSTYTYKVRSGDTLGVIAQKYLGSADRYKELLELNELKQSDAIYVGQKLKLPTQGLTIPDSNASLVKKLPAKESNTKQSYPELEAMMEAQQYGKAIQWIIDQPDLEQSAHLQSQLVQAALIQSKNYKRQQKANDAEILLSGLISDAPLTKNHQETLINELSTLKAEQELITAKRFSDKGKFDESYDILLVSWKQVGKPLENNILFTTTRNKVSENYHQKALRHYRNQELEDALVYWDKILAINPNDDLALVYQDRVKALQNKLDNL